MITIQPNQKNSSGNNTRKSIATVCFSLTILSHVLLLCTASFLVVPINQQKYHQVQARNWFQRIRHHGGHNNDDADCNGNSRRWMSISTSLSPHRRFQRLLGLASSPSSDVSEDLKTKNALYIEGLITNLQGLLDKYIMNGSPKKVRTNLSVNVVMQCSLKIEIMQTTTNNPCFHLPTKISHISLLQQKA